MDDAEQFLPLYLRFVKGVLDSSDLPLNVSREILTAERECRVDEECALSKRVLDMLQKMASNKESAQVIQRFWDAFGQVLKEGPGGGLSPTAKKLPSCCDLQRHFSDSKLLSKR